jgi:hypothetical protein
MAVKIYGTCMTVCIPYTDFENLSTCRYWIPSYRAMSGERESTKVSITRWKKKTLMFWFTQIHRTFFLVRILIIYKTYYIRMYMYYVLVYQRISCHLRDIFPSNMTNFTILKIHIYWEDIIVWSISSPVILLHSPPTNIFCYNIIG